MKTILSLLPWLMFPEQGNGLFISPDPDPNAGASGGGSAPPAGGAQPPAAPAAPQPAQPQGELRPIGPPAQPAGVPAPVLPPPAGGAQPPASPATPQSAAGSQPLTQADLHGAMSGFMQQLVAAGWRPPGQPAPAVPQPAAPATPPPVAPPAAAPPAGAPPAAPAQPAAPQPPGQPPAQPSNLEYQAVQNQVNEMQAKLKAAQDKIAEIDAQRRAAEQTATYAQIKETVRTAFTQHNTYRLTPDAATQATELLVARGALRNDEKGQTFVVLQNAQSGREEVWDMATGLTKFLESREGQFYRAAVPSGSGASGSHGGYPPVSIPNGGPAGQPANMTAGFQDAVEQQRRMEQGQLR